jgi:AcrR family transcriptional regulator
MAKRLSAEQRRRTIISAAKTLFAEKGFHGVSVDEIVNAVGVSPAVLYKYFASKEALYETSLREQANTREDYIEAVLDTDGSFEQVLRAMTRIFVASIAWQPDQLKMELHSLLEGTDVHRQFFDNHWKTFSDYIEGELEELLASGEAVLPVSSSVSSSALGPDPRMAALMFQGMLRELLISKALDRRDRFPDTPVDVMAEQMVTLFLGACGIGGGRQ